MEACRVQQGGAIEWNYLFFTLFLACLWVTVLKCYARLTPFPTTKQQRIAKKRRSSSPALTLKLDY